MSSGNVNMYERLFKLWATVSKMVVDGKRSAEAVADALQKIVNEQSLFNPHEYFKPPGIYVWGEFRKQILAIAKPTADSNSKCGLIKYDLTRDMTDAKIRTELRYGHVFEDAGVFCATLARMLDAQWRGSGGVLLNDGSANIFYVRAIGGEVLAVYVCWDSSNRKWGVNAYRLCVNRWYAGSRAFSARLRTQATTVD